MVQKQNQYLINRDLSWLRFNLEVLREGRRTTNPLLERVKFLAIAASNLDEFFEIRVARLEQQKESLKSKLDSTGRTPKQLLRKLYRCVEYLIKELYFSWNNEILTELKKEDIHILAYYDLSNEQKRYVDNYFRKDIYPVLTPIKVDPAHPFPLVPNKALCTVVRFSTDSNKDSMLGIVTIPRVLPRIIKIPAMEGKSPAFILINSIIENNVSQLFKGLKIQEKAVFRVTRNSNLYFNEEEISDLLQELEKELYSRKRGDAVRLEISKGVSAELLQILSDYFNLTQAQIHSVDGPVNFHRIISLYDMLDRADLKFKSFQPRQLSWMNTDENIFYEIHKQDFMLYHPYDSFTPVIKLVEKASLDPVVLSIKMVLYRVSVHSPLINYLIKAAQEGKEVTVIVELKARFDEASNVAWAKYLLDHGVHVVYGLLSLKTHCKLLLIVRREEGKLVKYAHIGTGNYNEHTALLYTDVSLFTARTEITNDVLEVLNLLTSQHKKPIFKHLLVAPYFMLDVFLAKIKHETECARAKKKAKIIFKVNSLEDPSIMNALYDAAEAGVTIIGIIRGICCMRFAKRHTNVIIKRIVGRYLEHARIFYFLNDKPYSLYIGSADWMKRNLRTRVEVVIPIINKKIEDYILNKILQYQILDNYNTSAKRSKYIVTEQVSNDKKDFNSQLAFMEESE